MAHPGGACWIYDKGQLLESGKQTGIWAVTYSADSKSYQFRASSVYKLAERLNMIPTSDVDYWAESHKAIAAIRIGSSYKSLGALSDTMRHILAGETGKSYKIEYTTELDEYDRSVYIFTGISENLAGY
jgi:hypothetical protein